MPIEDTTPAIICSAKVLDRTTGTGASLGTSSPNVVHDQSPIAMVN